MRKNLLTILSILLLTGLTVAAYAQLLPPLNLTAQAGDGYVNLDWEEPGDEPPDLVMLRQHNNIPQNAYFQSYGNGYGVVFDLAAYPGATLEHVDFRHSPWGINGTWQYKIHVVNWATFTTIDEIGPLATTVNNGWEMNIDLDSITGTGGLMGIMIEPMSNSPTDAYPCIDGDNDMAGYSAYAPITNWSGYTMSTVGDILIDLWIQPAGRSEIVKVERVKIPTNNSLDNHQVRVNTPALMAANQEMIQNAYSRELLGYNVYRNASMINVDPVLLTEYTDEDVVNGTTYSYYVTAVYTEGESVPSNTVEATPQGGGGDLPTPFNLTASIVGDDNVLLNWEAPEFGSWIQWDDGINFNAIGTNAAATFKVAARFSPDNLVDFGVVGNYLTIVRFFPYEANCTYAINVWTGGSATTPGTLVVNQPVPTPQINALNTVELNDPVYIEAGQELWIGYDINTQAGYPAGVDAGPAVEGYGNKIYFNNVWQNLSALNPVLDYNWNIHGFATYAAGRELIPIGLAHRSDYVPPVQNNYSSDGELALSPNFNNDAVPTATRQIFTGFRVYRNGVSIADTGTDVTTYLDESLEPGLYQYYVTALYEDLESGPSNTVTINTQVSTLLFDDFESYNDFALMFAPWTLIDLDQSPTYGFSGITFPNMESPMAYIIFNPSQTTPPLDYQAYSGDKMAASFASTSPPNNDWMITPRLELGDNSTLSFWARSYTAQYGLERLKVGVSTTSMLPTTFTFISETPYIEVPTAWTQYTFDLSNYDNQGVWIALNCVSNDAFILFIDDFHVQSIVETNVDEYIDTPALTRLVGNYPNPFNPETTISFAIEQPGQVSIEVFNLKGQKVATVVDGFMEAGPHNVVWNGKTDQNREAGSGIYFYRMKSGSFSSTKKMILMK